MYLQILVCHKRTNNFLLVLHTNGIWGFLKADSGNPEDAVQEAKKQLGIDVERVGRVVEKDIDGAKTFFVKVETNDKDINEQGEIIQTEWLEEDIARERITFGDLMRVFDEFEN